MITRLMAMFSAFLLTLSPVLADGLFNINVINDESEALIVSVTDMNSPSPQPGGTFSGNIAGGQQIPVQITRNGNGHVTWTATTVDRQKRGSGDVSGLDAGNPIKVGTPSSC